MNSSDKQTLIIVNIILLILVAIALVEKNWVVAGIFLFADLVASGKILEKNKQ